MSAQKSSRLSRIVKRHPRPRPKTRGQVEAEVRRHNEKVWRMATIRVAANPREQARYQ